MGTFFRPKPARSYAIERGWKPHLPPAGRQSGSDLLGSGCIASSGRPRLAQLPIRSPGVPRAMSPLRTANPTWCRVAPQSLSTIGPS